MRSLRSGQRHGITVNDYAGHPFQIELARELADRGHATNHLFCNTNVTPRADLAERDDLLNIRGLSTGSGFDKYNSRKRLLAEARYGLKSAWLLMRQRPAVTVLSNVPIVSLQIIQMTAFFSRTRTVLWLQDMQSGLAAISLGSSAHPVARGLRWLERRAIRQADAVVTISEAFADEAQSMGVDAKRVTTIENWAPLRDLPTQPRDNPWARRHHLNDKLVFLYSGTLGIKHRPAALIALAHELADSEPDAQIVVVSEGVGAEWLRSQLEAEPTLQNLLLLPFQPFADLPDVMASADVLIALLEKEAGRYCVPSKVLSYLCAGRPVLGYVPAENPASSLITTRAQAGLATDTLDVLLKDALLLAGDPNLRQELGDAGRRWAEANFSIGPIADRFEEVLDIRRPEGEVRSP